MSQGGWGRREAISEGPAEVTIREFEAGDAASFERLNEEWIRRYFVLEPKDEETLAHPEENILERGGRIFFAMRGGEAVGCCALLRMGEREYEVAKMAVTASCQGQGIGRRLLERVIAEARASGARRLYLETNGTLEPALRLYGAVGFRPVPTERIVRSPYARADVYLELYL